jgi:hypothetical protein
MRSITEITDDIAHIEFTRSLLNERLANLQQERDLLREDKFANERITKKLAEFFKSHGLFIVDLHVGERTEEHYELAKQIWGTRAVLVPFVKSIPKINAETYVYATEGLSAESVNSIRNLCEELSKKQWISYERREDGFVIVPSFTNAQKAFVHFAWSEEITLYLLDKALKAFTEMRHLRHKLFWDVKLKRIDPRTDENVDMQLDLVAQVGDRFYIFETKSGPVLTIEKWVNRTRLFDDGKNRFITCAANEQLDPMIFTPFRLFALPTLEQQFTDMLKEDFPLEQQEAPIPEPV